MRTALVSTALSGLLLTVHGLTIRDANAGCNKNIPNGIQPGESVNLTIASSSGETPRKYRLHLPSNYDKTKHHPLILSFHGRTQDALYQEELSQFSNPSFGFDGISVYPQGVPLINKDGKETPQWQGDPDAPDNISDVEFTLELIDHLQSTFCIDSSRIYAAGKSNGGGFTGLLACDSEASKRIAAFAVVSGAFYLDGKGKPASCNPGRAKVPLVEFHGFMDKTIRYAGGLNTRKKNKTESIVTYVEDWVKRNKIEDPVTFKPTHLCSGDKLVTKYGWGGAGSDLVMHFNYTNLKHNWPSSTPNNETGDDVSLLTCKDAEATSLILDWYKKWTLAGHV
ncbi:Alpha/Beta hydrolase protein [Phaeosphaeriaceae sp. PMI808]|nr:Alpha/Beta hydrolase protein [Phaeosphaeriaceae sp. PMI808]